MFNLNNMDSIFTRNKAVPVFYLRVCDPNIS